MPGDIRSQLHIGYGIVRQPGIQYPAYGYMSVHICIGQCRRTEGGHEFCLFMFDREISHTDPEHVRE